MNFHKLGEGYGTIAKRLDIPQSNVQSSVKKFKESGTTDTLPGHVRKPRFTARLTMKICQDEYEPWNSANSIAEYLSEQGIKISTLTIQQTLNQNGVESHCPHKMPLLMPCHIKAHLMYTKTFLNKESTFWDHILWSNKIKIKLFSHNDVKMIWQKER